MLQVSYFFLLLQPHSKETRQGILIKDAYF